MCGIVGLWHLDQNRSVSPRLIQKMTMMLRHRGPDDEGYLLVDTASGRVESRGGDDTVAEINLFHIDSKPESNFNLAFGFRRLSIIDISAAGHQPMSNVDGSLWLVYNGEIYNYIELRAELEAKGYTFKTATDTEVILCAYEAWGPDCLNRFNGMWAFTLWDGRGRQLFCARDRFGIKPFHYYWDGQTFAFASEIKALLSLPDFTPWPNDAVIYDYLYSGGLDYDDQTFILGIKQLQPGHYLTLSNNNQLRIKHYWHLDHHNRLETVADESTYVKKFYELFEDSVCIHLRSDVPIGTCLSGGLDSSSIVVIANKLLFAGKGAGPEQIGRQQKTFSSCFHDKRFDEREYIETVLMQTGAEANYTYPNPSKLMEEAECLVWYQDEPFRSTSMFAQWTVMKLIAEKGVKVVLDGQGGDELLAGYHPCFDYFWGGLLRQGHWLELWQEWSAYNKLYDVPFLKMIFRALRPFSPAILQRTARYVTQKRTVGLDPNFARTYRHQAREFVFRGTDPLQDYLYDLTRYGLPRLLRYEDRNSMAHSIEARVPFLDHRLVEYIFSLPANQKISSGVTKVILRNALLENLPAKIRHRKDKMGFVTPERSWLMNELDGWLRDIFTSESFKTRGYFDANQILKAFDAQRVGKVDLSKITWRWANLELWFRQFIDKKYNNV